MLVFSNLTARFSLCRSAGRRGCVRSASSYVTTSRNERKCRCLPLKSTDDYVVVVLELSYVLYVCETCKFSSFLSSFLENRRGGSGGPRGHTLHAQHQL